ncbi:hypothetical protein EXN66_Car006191 [Channa argus]|uniref:Uncharacterized protein n=1 Tax=Channa argus TaxID=215402 RepID=A0A6G1PKK5_CHAAH|nr:hypothetical protein EXN66_Car006191 [Channa argus]
MKSGMQPTPLQPRRANLKLLLASCFTERALWNTPSSPLPLHLTQPVASGPTIQSVQAGFA